MSILNKHKINKIKEAERERERERERGGEREREREKGNKGAIIDACVKSNAIKICRVGRCI